MDIHNLMLTLNKWVNHTMEKPLDSYEPIHGESYQRRLQKFLGEEVMPFLKVIAPVCRDTDLHTIVELYYDEDEPKSFDGYTAAMFEQHRTQMDAGGVEYRATCRKPVRNSRGEWEWHRGTIQAPSLPRFAASVRYALSGGCNVDNFEIFRYNQEVSDDS